MLLKIGKGPDHGFDEPLGLLSDCHRRIEHFLTVLIAILRAPERGPLSASERSQLEAAVTYFATAAPRHTADEEESLFPRLRQSGEASVSALLDILTRLEQDHRRADEHHAAADRLARTWLAAGTLLPDEAETLAAHLASLQSLYQAHIAIEDRELFPAAARLLSTDSLRAIGREMSARRSSVAGTST